MAASRPGAVAAGESGALLLAIESATAVTGVALFRGEACLGEVARSEGSATELLMPAVDALLREHAVRPNDLAAIAVSIGPGSFTGLRVGLATAKGLALGTAIELVPVPTLAALAAGAGRTDLPVLALLDARRGEMYASLYDCAADPPRVIVSEGVYAPEEIAPKLPERLVAVGEGAELFGAAIRRARGDGVELAPGPASARAVGRLGARGLARGEGLPPERVEPRYWRRAQAEVVRTGERFESPEGGDA